MCQKDTKICINGLVIKGKTLRKGNSFIIIDETTRMSTRRQCHISIDTLKTKCIRGLRKTKLVQIMNKKKRKREKQAGRENFGRRRNLFRSYYFILLPSLKNNVSISLKIIGGVFFCFGYKKMGNGQNQKRPCQWLGQDENEWLKMNQTFFSGEGLIL